MSVPDPLAVADLTETAERAVQLARQHGAQAADAMLARSTEFEVTVADGAVLNLTQATRKRLGLRVFVDGAMGFATSSDLTPASLAILCQSAVAGARVAAADPHNGLVPLPPGRIDAGVELRLSDPAILALSPEEKLGWAHAIEAAARGADPRVRRFRNSGVSTTAHAEVLVTSDGASRTLHRTGISAWSTPVAEANGSLQTESWYDSQSQLAALASPASIGQMAGERAARMLGARPVATQRVPVIFEPGMAAGFMRSLLAALDGDAVFKGASFLGTRCGEAIAASGLNLVDDPHLPGGMGSAPFDGEGLPSRRRALIEAGVLRGFLYDGYTARKAGVAPSACAQRSSGGLPQAGVFNLQVLPGTQTPAELVARPAPGAAADPRFGAWAQRRQRRVLPRRQRPLARARRGGAPRPGDHHSGRCAADAAEHRRHRQRPAAARRLGRPQPALRGVDRQRPLRLGGPHGGRPLQPRRRGTFRRALELGCIHRQGLRASKFVPRRRGCNGLGGDSGADSAGLPRGGRAAAAPWHIPRPPPRGCQQQGVPSGPGTRHEFGGAQHTQVRRQCPRARRKVPRGRPRRHPAAPEGQKLQLPPRQRSAWPTLRRPFILRLLETALEPSDATARDWLPNLRATPSITRLAA